MRRLPPFLLAALIVMPGAMLGVPAPAVAQFDDGPVVDPVPPPLPPREPRKDAEEYVPIVEEDDDRPWEMPAELMGQVQAKAEVYREYARRFTCDEVARLADYDASGEVSKERERNYAYLLLRDPTGWSVREYRQPIAKDGKVKTVEAEDEEPFPPAYEWVFLFSKFHEPFFSFRHLDTRFDGFDLVHEIQFKGSLPFTNGKDIRQWEGRVLIDAFTHTPIEIDAEPAGQKQKIAALWRVWNQSFNILGFRTKKPPLGYEAKIQFRYRRDDLSFPTELRYDTNKAVSPTRLVAIKASTRTYRNYKFTQVTEKPEMGDVVQP